MTPEEEAEYQVSMGRMFPRRQPEQKNTYRPDYDLLMDGRVHLVVCDSPLAAKRKAAALRTAARTRHMKPCAHVLGVTVAFMAE